jgi:DNA-binding CsgD family transcriptional regulator
MPFEQKQTLFDHQSLKSMGLTERETEVLAWVAEGKSNNDVGQILGIRSVTVKKHLEHIFQKMGVETRTAAVIFALRATQQIAKTTALLPFGYFLLDDIPATSITLLQLALFN